MKRRKDDGKEVYRSLVMVTQFGLNMIVPICVMSALGIWLDRKLDTSYLTIVLFVAGAVAGGQNIYRMAKRIYGEDERDLPRGVDDENSRETETEE